MRRVLEGGGSTVCHGAPAREDAYRSLAVPLAGSEGVLGYSVGCLVGGVGADTGPAGQLLGACGVHRVAALRVVDEFQQRLHMPCAGRTSCAPSWRAASRRASCTATGVPGSANG
ncbi:hypothetical protein GCM10010341_60250 [Streptomyces noursei]|nr:hypothetical protein GCM10010341_60250 [Streptomyces noursei]